MALDAAVNFGKVTVSTGYDAAAVTIVLNAGDGAKLPAVSFNAVWWNALDYADPTDDPNREIVRVTNISTDTLTVTRAQEGTSASTKNTAGKVYKMIAGLTAKVLNTDIGTVLRGTLVPFGGATSSFPALKRVSAALAIRLADDSADAQITAAGGTFSGAVTATACTLPNTNAYYVKDTAGTAIRLLLLASDNTCVIGTIDAPTSNGHVLLYTSGSERARITPAGLVGIGITGPNFILHTSAAAVALGAPASAPTDGNLNASNISFYLDESLNNLKIRVKYSNGTTLKTATIALV